MKHHTYASPNRPNRRSVRWEPAWLQWIAVFCLLGIALAWVLFLIASSLHNGPKLDPTWPSEFLELPQRELVSSLFAYGSIVAFAIGLAAGVVYALGSCARGFRALYRIVSGWHAERRRRRSAGSE
jgi:uncharacterized protein HemY